MFGSLNSTLMFRAGAKLAVVNKPSPRPGTTALEYRLSTDLYVWLSCTNEASFSPAYRRHGMVGSIPNGGSDGGQGVECRW